MRDGAASTGALLVAAAFAFSLPRLHFPWVPSIIYSTLATVTLLALYDFVPLPVSEELAPGPLAGH